MTDASASASLVWDFLEQTLQRERLPLLNRSENANEYLAQVVNKMTLKHLSLEPEKLAAEEFRVTNALETLAVEEYEVFLASSSVLSRVKQQMEQVSSGLKGFDVMLIELEERLTSFLDQSEELKSQLANLQAFSKNHEYIAKILSVQDLLNATIDSEMYDEALSLLSFADRVTDVMVTSALSRAALESNSDEAATVEHYMENSRGGACMIFLESLKSEISSARRRLEANLWKKLESESLEPISTTRVISYLTRLLTLNCVASLRDEHGRRTEATMIPLSGVLLEQQQLIDKLILVNFLRRRCAVLETQKQRVEASMVEDPGMSLRTAANLLRKHVDETVVHFSRIAQTQSQRYTADEKAKTELWIVPLYTFIAQQVEWFLALLEEALVIPEVLQGPCNQEVEARASRLLLRPDLTLHRDHVDVLEFLRKESAEIAEKYQPYSSHQIEALTHSAPFDFSALQALCKVLQSTGETLSRTGLNFFSMTAPLLDVYAKEIARAHLDSALAEFRVNLQTYSWTPSLVLSGDGSSTSSDAKAHFYEVTRHRPMAIYMNGLINMLNELRLCPLVSLAQDALGLLLASFFSVIRVSRDVGQTLGVLDVDGRRIGYWSRTAFTKVEPGGGLQRSKRMQKQEEFLTMCIIFSDVVVPIIAEHYAAIYPMLKFGTESLKGLVIQCMGDMHTPQSPTTVST